MSRERCEVCRFWLLKPWNPGNGWCRRYPPLPIVNIHANSDGGSYSGDAETEYPSLHKSDWCGEFQRAEKQEGEG